MIWSVIGNQLERHEPGQQVRRIKLTDKVECSTGQTGLQQDLSRRAPFSMDRGVPAFVDLNQRQIGIACALGLAETRGSFGHE